MDGGEIAPNRPFVRPVRLTSRRTTLGYVRARQAFGPSLPGKWIATPSTSVAAAGSGPERSRVTGHHVHSTENCRLPSSPPFYR